MKDWAGGLRVDPRPILTSSTHQAIAYFARREFYGQLSHRISRLWEHPECLAILRRQLKNGGWRYPGGRARVRSQTNYDQLETYRQLGVLVEKFGMSKAHPAIRRAAAFLLSFQSPEGDFRGIYGNQYSPNYSAAITELLIKAGYEEHRGVARSLHWLLSIRQDDGGWALPLRTRGRSLDVISMRSGPLEPDRARPSAHLITGIVLRAFAAHPSRRGLPEVKQAGRLLMTRFFQPDRYPDHRPASHWLVFSWPFWWTDLLSSLDSLTRLGFGRTRPEIASGLDWFAEHQDRNGLWQTGHNRPKGRDSDQWVALAACRLLKRSV